MSYSLETLLRAMSFHNISFWVENRKLKKKKKMDAKQSELELCV